MTSADVSALDNNDSTIVLVKDYQVSAENTIKKLLNTVVPLFPSDGLIFTPNILLFLNYIANVDFKSYTPYIFGSDNLLFKWQTVQQIRCEAMGIMAILRPNKLRNPNKIPFTETQIVQFKWNSGWEAIGVRTDKQTGNSVNIIGHLKRICNEPLDISCQWPLDESLLRPLALLSVEDKSPPPSPPIHPFREMDFDKLCHRIHSLTQSGLITAATDLESELTIYNYKVKNAESEVP